MPASSPLRPTRGGAGLGYHDHDVVDGGKARVVLTVLVTPAEVQDNQPALDLLWRARFRWKLHPRHVTGDSTYGTTENVVAIENQRIRAYVPLSEAGRRPGLFADTDFSYDAAADAYRCLGDEDDLDRVRGYHPTEPYAKAMRKRQVWVQPLFAEAKAWHGLRRFRLRGLPKVNGEALLIAAGQNLKQLLSRRGWDRRPWPSGAAGLVLPVPGAAPALRG